MYSALLLYGIALVAYIAYIVVDFYLANITNNPQSMAMVKVRLNSAFINSIILVLVMVVLTIVVGSKGGFPGMIALLIDSNSPVFMQDYVFTFFETLAYKTIPQLVLQIIGVLGLVQRVSTTFSAYSLGVVSGNLIDLSIFESAVNFMLTLATPMLGSIYAQLLAITLIVNIFPYLLGGGFVLRLFDLTKRAGTFMVAVALASYVIFIAMYAFNAYIFQDMISPSGLYGELQQIPEGVVTNYGMIGTAANVVNDGLGFFMNVMFKITFFDKLLKMFFISLLSFAFIIFQGILVPTFSTVVTMTSINALMKWLDKFA